MNLPNLAEINNPELRMAAYNSFVLGKVMDLVTTPPEKPKRYFYSTEVCWRCHFDLRTNYPTEWAGMTGCPRCNYSFVE